MAGLYIHIPFCKQACSYCNFYFSVHLKDRDRVVDAICKEIVLQKNYLQQQTLESIYWGGGTPAILTGTQIEKIVKTIQQHFTISANAEITIEANPDDLNQEHLSTLHQLGFNRLSIGTQSFFEEDLKYMHRSHTHTASIERIALAQSMGFHNISIDLIYGFPLLSMDKWMHNLNTVAQLNIPHLSCYALTVEPKTALQKKIALKKELPINDAHAEAQMQALMQWAQENNYIHYEISNFCKPNSYAVHNSNYWKGKHYLGIGPSAHSYNGHSRHWNVANNAKYIEAINNNQLAIEETELLTRTQKINELIMLGLRHIDGIQLMTLQGLMNDSEWHTFQKDIVLYTDYLHISATHIQLNNKGRLLADGIAAHFFVD